MARVKAPLPFAGDFWFVFTGSIAVLRIGRSIR
jgi:hypothetical protein